VKFAAFSDNPWDKKLGVDPIAAPGVYGSILLPKCF
jgi:hypothetical protein